MINTKHQIKLSCPAIKYLINVFYISKMVVDTQQHRKKQAITVYTHAYFIFYRHLYAINSLGVYIFG